MQSKESEKLWKETRQARKEKQLESEVSTKPIDLNDDESDMKEDGKEEKADEREEEGEANLEKDKAKMTPSEIVEKRRTELENTLKNITSADDQGEQVLKLAAHLEPTS